MNLLDQFDFPQVAREDFISKGLVQKALAPNVSEFQMAGHDKGLAYRFFLEPIKNEVKSEASDMEINDEVEMIQWFKDRKNKPVERARMLPKELLKFNKIGECVGGQYQEAYLNFKKGLTSTGLPIDRWGKLTIGECATLKSEGIHTVEQFAALPKDRVEGRFPKNLVQAFNEAIHFVNKQNATADVKPFADEMLALKQEIAKLKSQLEEKAQPVAEEAPKLDKRTRAYRDSLKEPKQLPEVSYE